MFPGTAKRTQILLNRAGSSSVLSQMEQSLRKRLRLSSPGQQILKNQENLTM